MLSLPLIAVCVVALFTSAGKLKNTLISSCNCKRPIQTNNRLNLIAVIFSKNVGILESFSRGLQAAAILNMNRPQQRPTQTTTETTPENDVASHWQMNSSFTYMPTMSGALQRVGNQ